MPPVAVSRHDQSRGRPHTAEDRMHELLAEHERQRSKGPTIFVPGVPTTTFPTVRLMGGADSHASPAR
eukprot:12097875-Heterocapsa_arctica.AAC.1